MLDGWTQFNTGERTNSLNTSNNTAGKPSRQFRFQLQFLKPRWDQNLEHVLALTTVTWMNVKWCTCILQTLGRKEIRNWFYQHSSSFKIDKKTPLRRQGRWYQMSDPGRKSLICLSCKLKLHLNLSRIVGIVGGTRGPLLLNIMVMVMIYREA